MSEEDVCVEVPDQSEMEHVAQHLRAATSAAQRLLAGGRSEGGSSGGGRSGGAAGAGADAARRRLLEEVVCSVRVLQALVGSGELQKDDASGGGGNWIPAGGLELRQSSTHNVEMLALVNVLILEAVAT